MKFWSGLKEVNGENRGHPISPVKYNLYFHCSENTTFDIFTAVKYSFFKICIIFNQYFSVFHYFVYNKFTQFLIFLKCGCTYTTVKAFKANVSTEVPLVLDWWNYCEFRNFCENFIFTSSLKRHICHIKNLWLRHDLPTSVSDSDFAFLLGFYVHKTWHVGSFSLDANFRENKTLTKISEFTVQRFALYHNTCIGESFQDYSWILEFNPELSRL